MTKVSEYQIFEQLSAALQQKDHVHFIAGTFAEKQFTLLWIYHWLTENNDNGKVIVICKDTKEQQKFKNYLSPFFENKHVKINTLPSIQFWGTHRHSVQDDRTIQRISTVSSCLGKKNTQFILTTINALCQKTLKPQFFEKECLVIDKGTEWDHDSLSKQLRDLGLREVSYIEEIGTFARKGNIFDIFSSNQSQPSRLEFWADEVTSIRNFSIETQRSEEEQQYLIVSPCKEASIPLHKRKQHSQMLYELFLEQGIERYEREGIVRAFQDGVIFRGFDEFAPLFREESTPTNEWISSHDIVVLLEPLNRLLESYSEFWTAIVASYQTDRDNSFPTLHPEYHFTNPNQIIDVTNKWQSVINFGAIDVPNAKVFPELTIKGDLVPSIDKIERFDSWLTKIDAWKKEGFQIVILASHGDQLERLGHLLELRKISFSSERNFLDRKFKTDKSKDIILSIGAIETPLRLTTFGLIIIPDHELIGVKKELKSHQSNKLKGLVESFRDIKVGSLVVHIEHGIGKYIGLDTVHSSGILSECVVVEYAGKDRVYVPVDRLNLLQKYSAGDASNDTKLDKLQGQNWEKRKSRAKKSIKDIADKLLKIHAQRKISTSHSCSTPGDLYFQFEADFPFSETKDQQTAISEVMEDLSGKNPMNRLLCGDVGFGKTEVALRASMRIVIDGLQVMVLVPTTVLCYQHFRTFATRFEKFGITVEQVNRFIAPKNIKKALERTRNGSIDILIGTHRILSKDVQFKKLGLIIVDEEQRFGVNHKETISQLSMGCNLLTLTATPIPRTFHMAMLGLRDISLITTAPNHRLPIKTYVSKLDLEVVKQAIHIETSRNGQVFFLHNRVENIQSIRRVIEELVPDYEVRVAHGQMKAQDLERVMMDFIDHKFPILLCTTIIESGVDIPNANTLIVNESDHFGLSQLYQMRGRVGRSNRQSYAWFFTSNKKMISDEAQNRLEILAANQSLGSGFKIASYDLEMRGAGNFLGSEQSGQISHIGFDLYTQMLEDAITKARGQKVIERVDTEINIKIEATIGADFIPSEKERLQIYKNIFSAKDIRNIAEISEEIKDRFGKLPLTVVRLLKVAELKYYLKSIRAQKIMHEGKDNDFSISFYKLNNQIIDLLVRQVIDSPDIYQLTPDFRLILITGKDKAASQDTILDKILQLVENLCLLLEGSTR